MGGIIGSVLAAAGDAGVQSMNQNIAQENALDLQKGASDLQMRNSLTLLAAQKQAAIDSANQMREAQASRISAALPGVVQGQIAAKYAPSDTAVAAANAGQTDAPLTSDQQEVIDQSKANDTTAFAGDPQAYVQAAIKTGDIDPHTVATLVQQDIALKRQVAAQQEQFAHADKSQAQAQAFQAQQQANSQKFQVGENNKNRDLRDTDTPFVKELKTLYPNGGPDYDEALRQRINKESGINAAGGGGRSVVYNGRIVASGNEVAAALKNITALPVTSNAGILGFGKPESTGIFNASVAALKNDLNPDQIKDYNTMWTGVSRNLGTLETSGLATTGSLISSIDKLAFVPGDNGYNALRKLAEVRQITEAALEPKLSDPAVPPDMKKYVQGIIDKVESAVPYTHADLTKFKKSQEQNPDLTFSEFAEKTLGAKLPQSPIKPNPQVGIPDPYSAPSVPGILNYDPQTGTFH